MLAKALVPGGDPVKAGAVADRPFYTPHSYYQPSRPQLDARRSTLDARRSTLDARRCFKGRLPPPMAPTAVYIARAYHSEASVHIVYRVLYEELYLSGSKRMHVGSEIYGALDGR